jgi:PAS domain S-box-containing protein
MGFFSWGKEDDVWQGQHNNMWDFIEKKIPIAIYQCSCDLERKLFFCNQTFVDITGSFKLEAGFQGKEALTIKSIVHPDDHETMDFRYSEAIRTQKTFHHEFRIIKPIDGSIIHVVDRGIPLKDKGKLVLSGYMEDITYLKSLKERETFEDPWLMSAVKASTDALWDWKTIENNISLTNGFKLLLGYNENEKIEHSLQWWSQNIHPEDFPGFANFMTLFIDNPDEILFYEMRIKKKSGEYTWVAVRGICQAEGSGKVIRMAGTVTDINAYKTLQEELRHKASDFEEISQAKSHFIASLNHDLRAPLNGIMGMVGLLKETALEKNQKNYIHNIHLSAHMLLELVNDILDVSKIAAGKLTLLKEPVDLRKIGHLLKALMDTMVGKKNIHTSIDIDENVPRYVLADAKRLKQILVNLASNASKFTQKGSISFSIVYAGKKEHSHMLTFHVKDTGIGIPPDLQEKIFEDFTQGHAAHYQTNGTGLGLSICKNLVRLMGGDICIYSEEGVGSTFSFTVCLDETTQAPQEDHENYLYEEDILQMEEPQIEEEPVSNNLPFYGLNILLAEDNRVNQEVMKGLIENFGDHLDIAEHGQEAVEMFQAGSYDVVLMDINMPIMDGLEAAAHIRTTQKGKDIPIIAVTANTMDADRDICLQKSMSDVLHKPVDKILLKKLLDPFRKNPSDHLLASSKSCKEIQENLKCRDNKIKIPFETLNNLQKDLGEEKIQKLVSMYIRDASKLVKQMGASTQASDIQNLAHNLAGMSENLGLNEMGIQARKIMHLSTDSFSPFSELIKELNSIFQNTKEALIHHYHIETI